MPSVELVAEPASNGNGHAPIPGPVTDTFDGDVDHSLIDNGNGTHSANPDDASNSESDDPHGVAEINNRRYGHPLHRSRNSRTSMALTDYSVNPSTPSDHKRQHIRDIVPEDYLLPNGHPDVSLAAFFLSSLLYEDVFHGSGYCLSSSDR